MNFPMRILGFSWMALAVAGALCGAVRAEARTVELSVGNEVYEQNTKDGEVASGKDLRFVAICNGDATSTESFVEPHMRAFHGKVVAIFRGEGNEVSCGFPCPLVGDEVRFVSAFKMRTKPQTAAGMVAASAGNGF